MKSKEHHTKLRVFNPLSKVGPIAGNATRLDTLGGKTICEIWGTGHWKADITFPIIRELLQKRFPDAKFVPYTEFPRGRTQAYPIPLDQVGQLLKNNGCDAVLLGNGG